MQNDFILGTVSLISKEPPSNNCNALLLKTTIKSVEEIKFVWLKNLLNSDIFFIVSYEPEMCNHFGRETTNENKQFWKTKNMEF